MIDIRPVGYVTGWLTAALGASMLLPLAADLLLHEKGQPVFATSAMLTLVVGVAAFLACGKPASRKLSIQQSFLLAGGIWIVFPFFGALPFMFGEPYAGFTDAFFEAMSALTTTGATVFTGLEHLPPGTLLWRGMMQWFGGLGILVVAMVFLPTLRVGGMQLFRSEGFDTLGKVLPKATQIALSLAWIYVALTVLCVVGYRMTGLGGFDALVHALTTVSTGGMANYDASFAAFGAGAQYVAVLFMILGSLPFARYIQIVHGTARPLLHDPQVRAFLLIVAAFALTLAAWLTLTRPGPLETAFRESLFNVVSIITGTGYASADYNAWGPFAMSMFFVVGLIGGCSGSTSCSVKVFRYQILLSAIRAETRNLDDANRVQNPRYAGRPIDDETMNSVMAFFLFFYLAIAVLAVALLLVGLSPITAISGAATAIANVGPGLGPEIGPAGNFQGLNDPAKWLLSFGMLLGRLELLSILVLFNPAFWRA